MWFPYTLPVQWKAESPREQVHEAWADQALRDFLVGFNLRNPVTRDWEVELHLQEPQWLQGTTADGEALEMGFYPGDNERLTEIMFRLKGTDPRVVAAECYDRVCRQLDYWSALYGRGLDIAGLRVADLRHDARWRVLPHRPSAETFQLPRPDRVSEEWLDAAALYRESRNTANPVFRLAGLGRVLRARSRDGEQATVTKEMLVLSGMLHFRPELEGQSLAGLPNRVEDWLDWARQRLADPEVPAPLRDYGRLLEAEALANLLDLAAYQALNVSLGAEQEADMQA